MSGSHIIHFIFGVKIIKHGLLNGAEIDAKVLKARFKCVSGVKSV